MTDILKQQNQKWIDDFYLANGPCCAGCDHWQWHNAHIGQCKKSNIVSSDDSLVGIGIVGCSLNTGAGHALTHRSDHCGNFIDTHEWKAN